METELEVDPIQVDLLHGKAYSDWGHASDAVSVYDQLISSHPNHFWVYLAKCDLIHRNFQINFTYICFEKRLPMTTCGDEQAYFFAPEKVRALEDRWARK
ncbi:hypothetical protein GH714_001157 [Hevea brasiliensis]|uniref:Uncharacterized protein n=1 Tax=Hevea brasiliensis TaxID=3981 RepID=A0A6A6MB44_HEVBR|nr:hypothetical protein GH714_001157 [Hevea brasiliensis]